MANETLVFGGAMAHKTLSLTFDEIGAAMGVFPNPASDVATFRFSMDADAQVALTLVDVAGRQVAVLLDANKGAGVHAETLALPTIPAGAYTVQLRVAGEVAGMQRLWWCSDIFLSKQPCRGASNHPPVLVESNTLRS